MRNTGRRWAGDTNNSAGSGSGDGQRTGGRCGGVHFGPTEEQILLKADPDLNQD